MSIAAEQALLGILIVSNSAYDQILGFGESNFVREDHRIIFNSLYRMIEAGKPVDLILFAEALDGQGSLERVGGIPYIGSLAQNAPSPVNIVHHARIVENAAVLRKLKAACNEISEACETRRDPKEVAVEAEAKILSVLKTRNERDYCSIGMAVAEAVDWRDVEKKNLSTGFHDLDRVTGGMGKSDLIIVAGRPSSGKTSLAMQIAENAAHQNSVAVFSLEMSRRKIANRMLRWHESHVETGEAIALIHGLKMQIDDTPAVSLGHIRSRCRRIKRIHGLSLIVVDYLQLMQGKGDNRTQEIGYLSRGLKALAKEFDVPLMALAQLSRKVEDRADKRPLLSDLRDSGEIEQDADIVIFTYRDEEYNKGSEATGTTEIIIRKNRDGGTGDVRLWFNPEFTRFRNYDGGHIAHEIKKPARGFNLPYSDN